MAKISNYDLRGLGRLREIYDYLVKVDSASKKQLGLVIGMSPNRLNQYLITLRHLGVVCLVRDKKKINRYAAVERKNDIRHQELEFLEEKLDELRRKGYDRLTLRELEVYATLRKKKF